MINRLKLLRCKLNLNQADFAKKMGMAQSTYATLELGKTQIRDRHINLICSTFNVNKQWLLTGDGNMLKDVTSERLGREIAKIFSDSDDLTKKILIGLSELDEKEIEIVKILVDGLVDRKKQLD